MSSDGKCGQSSVITAERLPFLTLPDGENYRPFRKAVFLTLSLGLLTGTVHMLSIHGYISFVVSEQ